MKPKCLDTRRRDGVTVRRYRKPSGRTIQTVEIPMTVFRSVRGMILPRVQAWERGEAARDRLTLLLSLAEQGNKQVYIAEVLGVSQAYVSKALKNHRARHGAQEQR